MGHPPNPLMEALDTDGNGSLSPVEIENAASALLALDRDGDGSIDEDEIRPQPLKPEDGLVARIMTHDRDADGMVSEEELPEHMKSLMERADFNEDGLIETAEIDRMVEERKSRTKSDTELKVENTDRESESAE